MNATIRNAPSITTKMVYLRYREILKLHHKRLQFYFLKVANQYMRREFERHLNVASEVELEKFISNCDNYKESFCSSFSVSDKINSERLSSGTDLKYYEFLDKNRIHSMDKDKPLIERESSYHERIIKKYQESQQNMKI